MRAVVQRVSRARSTPSGAIGAGLCLLLGGPAETGVFGAQMTVELTNDGPVTITLE